MTVGPAATRRLLDNPQHQSTIRYCLEAVPPTVDITRATTSVLKQAGTLYETVKHALKDPSAANPDPWVTASKLCARKRPSLIPVRDRKVRELLGIKPPYDYRLDWQLYRNLVHDNEIAQLLSIAAATAGTGAPGGITDPPRRILDGTVQLWDLVDVRRPVPLRLPLTGLTSVVESVAFSQNGRLLAAGSTDGTVQLWDTADPRRPKVLATLQTTQGAQAFSVAFSRDGLTLAVASADRTVWLWDLANPGQPTRLREPLSGPTSYVYHVIFSPDGRTLAAGSADGAVRLWDMSNRHHPRPLGKPLTGPKGFVFAVAFAPDGQTLAAASGDKTVWLWNLRVPDQPGVLAVLTGPTEAVFSVAFSPDGHSLAASGQDKTVRLWTTNPDEVAGYVCSIAGDPITEAEWNQYIPGRRYNPPCRQ